MVYIFACLWFFYVSKLYPKEALRRLHIFNKIFVQICGDILVVCRHCNEEVFYWHQSIKCLVILFMAAICSCSSVDCQDNSYSGLSQMNSFYCTQQTTCISCSLTIYFCVMSWHSAYFISFQSFIDANLTLWLPVVVKTEILNLVL